MARRGRITIRDYRSEDEAAVIAIARELQAHEAAVYDRSRNPGEIGRWYIEALLENVRKHNGSFLVAELDSGIAGYATLLTVISSEGERDEIDYTYSGVGDIAVLKSQRDRGIGHALIAECERLACAAGQKWLRLGVIAANHGARAFYRKMGLEEKFLTLEKQLA